MNKEKQWTQEEAQNYIATQFNATSHYMSENGMFWALMEDMQRLVKNILPTQPTQEKEMDFRSVKIETESCSSTPGVISKFPPTQDTESWEETIDKMTWNIGEHHSQDCCDYWRDSKVPEIKDFIKQKKNEWCEDAVDIEYAQNKERIAQARTQGAEAAVGYFYKKLIGTGAVHVHDVECDWPKKVIDVLQQAKKV